MLKRIYLWVAIVSALAVGVAVARSADDQNPQKEKAEKKERAVARSQSAEANAFALAPPFGEGSYLGVFLEEVTADRVKELGLPEERGALVMKVVEGSPASKAGLKENDVVIAFNGRRVDSVREFQRLLSETPAERSVALEVVRGGSHQNLTATLTKRSQNFKMNFPEINERALKSSEEALKHSQELLKGQLKAQEHLLGPDFGNFTFMGPGNFGVFRGGRLGISVESLTEQLAEYFGVKDGHGVLVSEVDANGAAGKAGIKAGDVIVGVDSEKVENVNSLVGGLNKKTEGQVVIRVVRNRSEQTVTVTLEKRPAPATPRRRAGVISRLFNEA